MAGEVPFLDVARHATPDSCWVIFQDKVFDLTEFAKTHPGGASLITDVAGTDGTATLKEAHPGGIKFLKYKMTAAEYAAAFKGEFAAESRPPLLAHAEVARHSSAGDCWVVLEGDRVFDLTAFLDDHPGGGHLISDLAGTDATDGFRDAHSEGLEKVLDTLGDAAYRASFRGLLDRSTVPVPAASGAWLSSLRPGRTAALAALLVAAAAVAVAVAVTSGTSPPAASLPMVASGGFGAGWLCGVLVAALVALAVTCRRRVAAWFSPPTGIGGWRYNQVSAADVERFVAAADKSRVFWRAHPGADSEIKRHSRDMGFHATAEPEVVVYPLSAEEVAAIARICHERRIPLVPRGAGSGLEGGAVPYQGGVVLNLMRMKTMRLLAEDMYVCAAPGVKKSELNAFLEPHGFLFGPDPASNPSVGGMVSTRGSGLSTILYGTTKENVVALQVVTPEGKIVATRQRVRKSSTGYDLTQLYIGSEGTLGVVTEATFRIFPIQKQRCGAFITFPAIADAAGAVIEVVRSSVRTLCRCELLNADGIRATNKKFQTELVAAPTVFLEFRGASAEACTSDWAAIKAIAERYAAQATVYSTQGDELDRLWEARRGCYLAAMSFRESAGDRVYLSDTCVPISQLAKMVKETEEDFVRHGFPCIICAHIAGKTANEPITYDGNFHCCVPYQPAEKAKVVEVEHAMISRAIGLGGTVSGEHGVGVGKIEHVEEEHGPDHLNIQRGIKRALDPRNIMNPGKMFILPKTLNDSTAVPALYHQTTGSGEGTYVHGE